MNSLQKWSALLFFVFILSCNGSPSEDVQPTPVEAIDESGYFPVTAYIKGQIASIKSMGINPMKTVTMQKTVDTSWLPVEAFAESFGEFTDPVIDTANMIPFFSEAKFADQTLNTFTFLYSPKSIVPDTIPWRNWAVYISPETNKVTRIYLVKRSGTTEKQLTWNADQGCKIVTIEQPSGQEQMVTSEEEISWKFD